MKWSISCVHHFNYAYSQWRIPGEGVAAEYSKRMFLNYTLL